MPIDLSALGQIGSAAAGTVPLAQQRWAAAQQAQQEAEAQRRELAAQQIFGSLGPDMPDLTQLPGGQQAPQAPAPGQSSQPMTMNQAFAPSAATGSPGPSTAVAPSSPPGAFPGAGPSATPVGTGATGQPVQGQPGLGAFMQYLRQRNPGMDPASIGLAAERTWHLVAPLQQQKFAQQERLEMARLYSRENIAQQQIASREQIAQWQIQARDQLVRLRQSLGGGAGAKETPAERAQHAYLQGQIADVQRRLAQAAPGDDVAALQQQLFSLGQQVNAFNAGVARRLGGGGGGVGTPAAAGVGPEGAPDPKTLQEGAGGTDANGQHWTVKGGAWVKG